MLALVAACAQPLMAQPWTWAKDKIGAIFADTTQADRPRFVAYPTIAFSPETSWEFGVSSLLVYHAGRDTTNRLSEISAFAFFTLESQYGFWLDHALYTDQDTWFFLGKLRLQSFPLRYYGIGGDTPPDFQAVVAGRYALLRERALRRVYRSLYLGIEADYQSLGRAKFNWSESAADQTLPLGHEGSTNVGLGLGLVFDDRHNVLNVREGFFGELAWLRYANAWGSDYSFDAVFLDLRYFVPTWRNQVFAMQLYSHLAVGSIPFNHLPAIGGETIMRGYYLGRYRDKMLNAVQAEYRWLPFPFSKRWGAAAFLATGSVSPALSDFRLSSLQLTGGAGLRFLLFPRKDIYTRLDLAFSRDGTGIYFFIGEAF